ncbi:glycerophosphodiester phosphodiesterase GDPD4 [Euphorbia lathyris]|uniref:glycerophosphodiester phosphodiesterase GDPD4 n=1 Tax=Euphorbia lathyris TaxID=212925 RepID=UPI0033141386
MGTSGGPLERRRLAPLLRRRTAILRGSTSNLFRFRLPSSRRTFRLIIISLALIALFPPIFFHFRLRHFQQRQLKKCGWLNNPPLVCAHGGDSTNAFPNTMAAYHLALRSRADCIEIDVSRSLDGVLFALHDRDLQKISGNATTKVGHLTMKEIKELYVPQQSIEDLHDRTIPTIEDALKFVSSSVQQIVLDAKVGPPSYEKGLAKDILSVVDIAQCKNCLVWAKSDTLARDVIRLSSDTTVGYIVMVDPNTGNRMNLLRMKGAEVVGVYHPLVDETLVRIVHRRNRKVYAWTVDDVDSMRRMLFERVDAVVTSNPSLMHQLVQDITSQCREEGFSMPRR